MGGNSSKHPSPRRAASFRTNQKKTLLNFKQDLERISHEIQTTNEITDEKYENFITQLKGVENELHFMKRFIRGVHKNKYDFLIQMLQDIDVGLKTKTKRIVPVIVAEKPPEPPSTVQLTVVKFEVQNDEKQPVIKFEENCEANERLNDLQLLRTDLENTKSKIYLFGGTSKSFEYVVLLQEINNVKSDLNKIDSTEMPHLKHERKIILHEVENCLTLLEDKAAFNESSSAPPISNYQTVRETPDKSTRDSSSSSDNDYDIVYDSSEDVSKQKTVTVTSL